MKIKLIFTAVIACLFLIPTKAQFIKVKDESIIGYYKVTSIKINFKVDLNKDGKKSSELFDEFNDCQKDISMELLPDHTATLNSKTEKCKEEKDIARSKVLHSEKQRSLKRFRDDLCE